MPASTAGRKAGIIAVREYLARIKSKGFWIATLIMPLLMAVWVVLPSLMADRAAASQELVIAGGSDDLYNELARAIEEASSESGGRISFAVSHRPVEGSVEGTRQALDDEVLRGEIGAWLWLGDDPLAAEEIEYHASSTSNVLTQSVLDRALSRTLRRLRLDQAGYDGAEVETLIRGIDLKPVQVTEEGTREGGALGALMLAFFLFFSLYMGIVMYGQQVLNGVLEEKSSRVVEVMLSAVSPSQLMFGKLAGICGAALTQMLVWLGTALIVLTPGLVAARLTLPEGAELPTLPLGVVIHFLSFFLLGFGIYAAFYAMLGAAFNSQQEAQQMSFFGISFLIAPFMVMMPVINDPDSTLAVVMSLIPMFTPLLMVLRIAVKMPPTWQIALAYLLTTGFFLLMVWLAARVYRVGILMYGKKPTFAELWRWVRHA